jgi:hypothetical protein
MTYKIAWIDGDEEVFFKHEIFDVDGYLDGYGEDMVFDTKEQAENFLRILDEREFDRYVVRILENGIIRWKKEKQ